MCHISLPRRAFRASSAACIIDNDAPPTHPLNHALNHPPFGLRVVCAICLALRGNDAYNIVVSVVHSIPAESDGLFRRYATRKQNATHITESSGSSSGSRETAREVSSVGFTLRATDQWPARNNTTDIVIHTRRHMKRRTTSAPCFGLSRHDGVAPAD